MVFKHEPASKHPTDILQHYLEDIVYGASDGIVTTFALVSGVMGAKLAPMVIIILGFVNLFADGASMAASRYLSIRAGASVHGINRGIKEPLSHGLFIFASFFLFGLFPLISFMIPSLSQHQFLLSCIITGVVLFIVGSLRIFISKKRWLRGGMEMLVIGGSAAAIAYFVGYIIKHLVS